LPHVGNINPQNPVGHFASQVSYMMIVTFIRKRFCKCVSAKVKETVKVWRHSSDLIFGFSQGGTRQIRSKIDLKISL